jgi:hypothetical protein
MLDIKSIRQRWFFPIGINGEGNKEDKRLQSRDFEELCAFLHNGQ